MGTPAQAAFAFRHITKHFGAVTANKDISFSVARGSKHGVVGENGAGKSTIMKILYGMYPPDAGEIEVDGKATRIRSPQEAIALGIGMVHQHFMLVPTLTVWQNIVLGSEPAKWRLRREQVAERLETLQREFGCHLNLDAVVETLSVGEQQQVEILKLLYRNADILILDEPTAVLTPQEVTSLFDRLNRLGAGGKTIVLVSHKLKEILEFTDWVTILRDGEVIETTPTRILDPTSLAERIIGRKIRPLPERKAAGQSETALEVRDLVVERPGRNAVRGISFDVHAGEIVGIAGVEGNGQAALVEAIAGVEKKFQGTVSSPKGLAVIPPDRLRQAVIAEFPVWENFLLGNHREPRYSKRGWILRENVEKHVTELVDHYDVRPRDSKLRFSALSGGNQQKAVIARELSEPRGAVIAAHPTRGVDVGAIEFIHKTLLERRDEGCGILLLSSELEEILALSDRILVLHEGKIVGETLRAQANETKLGLWMTGGKA